MIDPKYKVVSNDYEGAKGLIVSTGNSVLVIRRGLTAPNAPGEMDLPGGKSEQGESPWTTFIREAAEEVHLDLSHVELIAAHSHTLPNGRKVWLLVVKVELELINEARAGAEASEVITEGIDAFLQREDAWEPFQKHAHYMASQLGLTSIPFTTVS